MQNHRNTSEPVLIAEPLVYLTECALNADITTEKTYSMQNAPNGEARLPRIGIDLLGGDKEAAELAASLSSVLSSYQNTARFLLFGDPVAKEICSYASNITFQETLERIGPEEPPLSAVRTKKSASLLLGIDALKNGEIDALLTVGNTGALLAAATTKLKLLPSVSRAALLTLLPIGPRGLAILDVGANTDVTSSHLVTFAAMGIAYRKAFGISHPAIGLLNIGKEPNKGPSELKEAHRLLSEIAERSSDLFFLGNLEPGDLFTGKADVLVTGGFAGNIFLKTLEQTSRFLTKHISSTSPSPFSDYRTYPGAVLAGVRGIVIKCHGEASASSLAASVPEALRLIKESFLEKIEKEIPRFFHNHL